MEGEFSGEDRRSRPEVFYEKGVLRNVARFTGNRLCQSLFFNKAAGLRPTTLLNETPFLQNTSGRLLLNQTLRLTKSALLKMIFYNTEMK